MDSSTSPSSRNQSQSEFREEPHDLDAERAVLGSLLIERDAIFKVATLLKPSDFYDTRHQALYTAILSLYHNHKPSDMVTLHSELERTGTLESAGGIAYVSALMTETITAVYVMAYAGDVKEKSRRRAILAATLSTVKDAYDESIDVPELATRALAGLSDAVDGHQVRRLKSLSDLISEAWEHLDDPEPARVRLGWPDIDRLIGGIAPKQLVVIAARPSVGKSAFAVQAAHYHAVKQGRRAAIFSLEMSDREILERLTALESGVNMHAYRALGQGAEGKQAMRESISRAYGKLSGHGLHVYDTSDGTLSDVILMAKSAHATIGIDLLIVDYLQLIENAKRDSNRVQEISSISRRLKTLARELDIPIIALAQLNRSIELRPKGQQTPVLSDLRDSGSIEQDADIVIFLHRPDFYDEAATKNVAQAIVAKNRNGPTSIATLVWHAETTTFKSHLSEVKMPYAG